MPKARIRASVLRADLLRRGMTQGDLARRLRISDGYLSELITGKKYAGRVLRLRLMTEIGVGFDALFEIVEPDEVAA